MHPGIVFTRTVSDNEVQPIDLTCYHKNHLLATARVSNSCDGQCSQHGEGIHLPGLETIAESDHDEVDTEMLQPDNTDDLDDVTYKRTSCFILNTAANREGWSEGCWTNEEFHCESCCIRCPGPTLVQCQRGAGWMARAATSEPDTLGQPTEEATFATSYP